MQAGSSSTGAGRPQHHLRSGLGGLGGRRLIEGDVLPLALQLKRPSPTARGNASQFCIIVNSPGRYKMAIISKTVVPDVALVDPETTVSMDPT